MFSPSNMARRVRLLESLDLETLIAGGCRRRSLVVTGDARPRTRRAGHLTREYLDLWPQARADDAASYRPPRTDYQSPTNSRKLVVAVRRGLRSAVATFEETHWLTVVREIPGAVGPLEALLDVPDGAPRAAVVFAHPLPTAGGTMHTKAVLPGNEGARPHRLRGPSVQLSRRRPQRRRRGTRGTASWTTFARRSISWRRVTRTCSSGRRDSRSDRSSPGRSPSTIRACAR